MAKKEDHTAAAIIGALAVVGVGALAAGAAWAYQRSAKPKKTRRRTSAKRKAAAGKS